MYRLLKEDVTKEDGNEQQRKTEKKYKKKKVLAGVTNKACNVFGKYTYTISVMAKIT